LGLGVVSTHALQARRLKSSVRLESQPEFHDSRYAQLLACKTARN
jgi:hypothetical protein